MRRLPRPKRAQILHQLVEGNSLEATARLCDVSPDTVAKLLFDAGDACTMYHDRVARDLRRAERIQIDEIWCFVHCKQGKLPTARKPPEHAGDTYTWLALDEDSRFLISWVVGRRDQEHCDLLIEDLARRVPGQVRLTTDGLPEYRIAVNRVFGDRADYAQLRRKYSRPDAEGERRYSAGRVTSTLVRSIQGRPNLAQTSTALIERHNLNVRMSVRRFTRMSNAFSKKLEYLARHVSLYATYHNFVRIHKTLRVTPAMELGIAGEVRDFDWLVDLVKINTPPPAPRGSQRRQQGKPWREEWTTRSRTRPQAA